MKEADHGELEAGGGEGACAIQDNPTRAAMTARLGYSVRMLLFSLFFACKPATSTDDSASVEPEPYLAPAEAGPWAVGTDQGTLVRDSGEEEAIQVWYPAEQEDDGTAARYRYDGLIEGTALETSTPDCAEVRPVLVFSHGSGGIRWQSLFYTELLASRGWVVVAPDHAGNTYLDQDDTRMAEEALLRPHDVALAFDWAVDQSAQGSLLEGCVDEGAGYAVSGHSYGGYTSLAVAGATLDLTVLEDWCADVPDDAWCEILDLWEADHPGESEADLSDSRAWASVAMTPAGEAFFGTGVSHVDVPTEILAGTLDDTTPTDEEARPMFEDLTVTPRALAVIDGAGHLSFSDVCELSSTFDECGDGYLPPEDVHRIALEVAVPFLDWARGVDGARDVLPPDEPALSWTLTE